MEKAIFISKIKDLRYVTGNYPRLYFGNEFCQDLIPSEEELDYALSFAVEKRLNFTFVTPYVTNTGMERLKLLMHYLIGRHPASETVINDWGFLRWLNEKYPCSNLILGRLLTRQKRGPRILKLKGRVPEAMIQHFRQSNIDSGLAAEFLTSKGVKRVELDNLLQGIARPPHSLRGSLYIPFAYVTTTRFCLIGSYKKRLNYPLRSILPCNKECQRYAFKLRHRQMPVELFLKGNTQFFKNEHLPENLNQLNIDRLVYQPEIPL